MCTHARTWELLGTATAPPETNEDATYSFSKLFRVQFQIEMTKKRILGIALQ